MNAFKKHVRLAAALIGAPIIAIAFLSSAQAYDRSACDRMFGSANVQRAVQFEIEAGDVDFGDDFHVLGAPRGDAVACWSIDGRAGVIGKVYADELETIEAIAEISFRRTNGRLATARPQSVRGSLAASRQVEAFSPPGNFNAVIVRLKVFRDTALGPTTRTLAVRTIRR